MNTNRNQQFYKKSFHLPISINLLPIFGKEWSLHKTSKFVSCELVFYKTINNESEKFDFSFNKNQITYIDVFVGLTQK